MCEDITTGFSCNKALTTPTERLHAPGGTRPTGPSVQMTLRRFSVTYLNLYPHSKSLSSKITQQNFLFQTLFCTVSLNLNQ